MRKFELSAYGVEEMNQKELIECGGGWWRLIGPALELLYLIYTIFRDNCEPEVGVVSAAPHTPPPQDGHIVRVEVTGGAVNVGYQLQIVVVGDSTDVTISPI